MLRRLILIRVQEEDLPRMESTNTSSAANKTAACGWPIFHLSRPANAASLLGELAITISGALGRGFFVAEAFAREGETRGDSPSALRKCGGQGASPRPADSSLSASASRPSRDPGVASMSA